MAKADVLQAFRQISSDSSLAAAVGAGDLSVLGPLDFSDDEEQMVISAAGELAEHADDVVGFSWTDPAGGGNDDAAAEGYDSSVGLTFTRSGDARAEYRYVKQLTNYVGLGKPGI